ncbi:G-protein-signaling modulator 2 [Bagarius yarrelli]|uniref:G-protein-signaling modulator 2 n=1 Tax=Bagarius yarrelli TaxID=175774 RepID=A0A556U076_BAGYA|nr:G-protein-signaling modulator 2 [Bagarius yarrelli]
MDVNTTRVQHWISRHVSRKGVWHIQCHTGERAGEKPEMSLLRKWLGIRHRRRKKRMEASCLELALEGERLCKTGDYRAGVSFFESAIQVGTEDLQILSAIYSQLGNAYFHLQDYAKALEFHRHDLTLTRTIGDQLGEAKASGNLGNTLKVLGRYDEAATCCQRHLDISRMLHDKVGQARALYNYGNVYHAKGKNICWSGTDPGEFPEEARIALKKAAEANLSIVKELGDRAAQGRTYGNLGNTHYLLGNFENAVLAHEQRLLIAKEFGDRAAERRAYCNLGNAYIFLGQFEVAAENYKQTHTTVGSSAEGPSGRSSGLLQFGQHIGDRSGELTARMNVSDLQLVSGLKQNNISSHIDDHLDDQSGNRAQFLILPNPPELESYDDVAPKQSKISPVSKTSSKLFFIGRFKSKKQKANGASVTKPPQNSHRAPQTPELDPKYAPDTLGDEGFFDLLTRFQGNRMDDQRCSLQGGLSRGSSPSLCDTPPIAVRKPISASEEAASAQPGHFLDLLASSQGRRLDEQRASVGTLPGLLVDRNNSQAVLSQLIASADNKEPDDDFFDILIKCQGSRLDDQRCAPPPPPTRGPTVPDEDFFSLILRSQAKRMDEQRVNLPSDSGPTSLNPD